MDPEGQGAWGPSVGPRGVLDLVSGQSFRSLVALAILISSTACDNVEWGGMDLHFVQPPPPSSRSSDVLSMDSRDSVPPFRDEQSAHVPETVPR